MYTLLGLFNIHQAVAKVIGPIFAHYVREVERSYESLPAVDTGTKSAQHWILTNEYVN